MNDIYNIHTEKKLLEITNYKIYFFISNATFSISFYTSDINKHYFI